MDSYNPSLSPFSIFLSDQLTNRPNDSVPPRISATSLQQIYFDLV